MAKNRKNWGQEYRKANPAPNPVLKYGGGSGNFVNAPNMTIWLWHEDGLYVSGGHMLALVNGISFESVHDQFGGQFGWYCVNWSCNKGAYLGTNWDAAATTLVSAGLAWYCDNKGAPLCG